MQRILLVEDNAMNRDLISRRLKRRGFEVLLAEDGAAGVEKTAAEKPDLVLMDMGLPVMDGYTAARVLKENEETRNIPIIGLSAHAMSGDADRALKAGCDDYDTKPVEWPRLLSKIQAQLEKGLKATVLGNQGIEEEQAAAVAAKSGKVVHLLVVDDNTMHCEILRSRLAALGHLPKVAQDSARAIELLGEHEFGTVLLDASLPQEGGVSLLRYLHEKHSGIPVLLISLVDAVDIAVDAMKAGQARDYISPPFRSEVLAARVDACLGVGGAVHGQSKDLEEERRRSAHLLASLLPRGAVRELEESGRIMPRRAADAVLLAWDVAGFSRIAEAGQPQDVLSQYQELMVAFEEIALRNGVEKIRSAGESCLAVAGLFKARFALDTSSGPTSIPLAVVRCALELRNAAQNAAAGWKLRIGVHQGPVLAGAVGHQRVQFDVWGHAVETVSLVKEHGFAGAVNVSAGIWEQAHGRCIGEALSPFPLPGGGSLGMFRIDSLT